jgi:hypothetical protein
MTETKVFTAESIEQDLRDTHEGQHTQIDSEVALAEITKSVEAARRSLITGEAAVNSALGKIDAGMGMVNNTQPEEVFVKKHVDMAAIHRGVADASAREDWTQSRGAL